MKKFEYRLVQVRNEAVIYVNGEWQGEGIAAEAPDSSDPLQGCPKVWAYLDQAGDEGWELVAATPRHPDQGPIDLLYLKKDRFG